MTSENSGHPSIFRSVNARTDPSRWDGLVADLRDGQIDLDAPYQRGHVWGRARQIELIELLTTGLGAGAIYLNTRGRTGPRVCIDGKQRLTAVRAWLDGDLVVPAHWFDHEFRVDPRKANITFLDLTATGSRLWRSETVAAVLDPQFTGPDVEQREKRLFDLINGNGVAQGDIDDDIAIR